MLKTNGIYFGRRSGRPALDGCLVYLQRQALTGTGQFPKCRRYGQLRAWLPQTAVFILTGPNGDRRDVSSWKSWAPSGTLCIVACLARMTAVDTPHHVTHTPPRSTSSVEYLEQKPPETSRLCPVSRSPVSQVGNGNFIGRDAVYGTYVRTF